MVSFCHTRLYQTWLYLTWLEYTTPVCPHLNIRLWYMVYTTLALLLLWHICYWSLRRWWWAFVPLKKLEAAGCLTGSFASIIPTYSTISISINTIVTIILTYSTIPILVSIIQLSAFESCWKLENVNSYQPWLSQMLGLMLTMFTMKARSFPSGHSKVSTVTLRVTLRRGLHTRNSHSGGGFNIC